jgi:hypothetical protein
VAEEIAMIDMLSGSRLVYGFVRGIDLLGQEVMPALKVYQAPGEGALATGSHLRHGEEK